MKRAILYMRVASSDPSDQTRGFLTQQIQLETYCALNDIEIVCTYKEQGSGKTLKRKIFQEMIYNCIQKHTHLDFVLFTNWDRIHRGMNSELYPVVAQFYKWDIIPLAIFQPSFNEYMKELAK